MPQFICPHCDHLVSDDGQFAGQLMVCPACETRIMNEHHETDETEPLRDETWCSACKRDVAEWKVCFESSIHTDSGYDKVHRCPYCNAHCFADRSFSVGCFFFFLGLFGAVVWVPVLGFLGIDVKSETETSHLLAFLFMLAHGFALSWIVTFIWKRVLYTRRHSSQKA